MDEAEWRERRREAVLWRWQLRRDVRADTFLEEWQQAALSKREELAAADLAAVDLNEAAESVGFRSARAWRDAIEDHCFLLGSFLTADAFKRLWKLMREHDRRALFGGHAYSPAPGGVPHRLLDALTQWHQVPKFTTSERQRHDARISDLCTELEALLVQVHPSHDLDPQYSHLAFQDVDQASAVFRVLGGEEKAAELQRQRFPDLGWHLAELLKIVGITPLWAVRNLKRASQSRPKEADELLPRKVRTKTAKRTFLARALYNAIAMGTMGEDFRNLGVTHALMAELVGVMSNMDCTVDDLRKALPLDRKGGPED